MVSFEPVELDLPFGDSGAVLVYRDRRLAAVLTRLGELHGDAAGRWFVEAMFLHNLAAPGGTFVSPEEFRDWLESGVAHGGG